MEGQLEINWLGPRGPVLQSRQLFNQMLLLDRIRLDIPSQNIKYSTRSDIQEIVLFMILKYRDILFIIHEFNLMLKLLFHLFIQRSLMRRKFLLTIKQY